MKLSIVCYIYFYTIKNYRYKLWLCIFLETIYTKHKISFVFTSEQMINILKHQGSASQEHKVGHTAWGSPSQMNPWSISLDIREMQVKIRRCSPQLVGCLSPKEEKHQSTDTQAFRQLWGGKNSAGLLKGLAVLPSLTQDPTIYLNISSKKR